MRKTRILVVDDEPVVLRFLQAILRDAGYDVLSAPDGAEALRLTDVEVPNLVITDIIMPRMDGFEVCRRLREWSTVPVIMLSARADEMDKVKCLDLGADDYITKPFGTQELLARVRAALRHADPAAATTSSSPTFTSGELEVNFAARRVTVAGREVKLTRTEFNLLQELVLNADKVFTHRMLLQKVWGPEYGDEKEYLHVFIGRLRKQVECDPDKPAHIITVSGVGYQFKRTA